MTVLSAEALTVRRGGRTLLDGVSVAVRPGELLGIVGPNGAGKSTLLRCLAGSIRPDSGTVRLGDAPLAALSGHERARRLGYVPQRFEPAWDYRVRDVLEMGAARVPGSAATLPEAADESDLCGLLDRRWSSLSGGERARALLASVLVTRPPVLIADEPGASLDIRHKLGTLARLKAYAGGRAVAVVLHELDLAVGFCDRLIVLQAGRIAIEEPAAEIARSGTLDAVFGIPFQRIPWTDAVAAPLPIRAPP